MNGNEPTIRIPDAVWDLPLFSKPAQFPEPATPLEAERIDLALRRLKNLPETTAQAEAGIAAALEKQLGARIEHLARKKSPLAVLLQRVQRMQSALRPETPVPVRATALRSLCELAGPELAPFVPDAEHFDPRALNRLALMILEGSLRADERSWNRYRARIFSLVEKSLEPSPTSDARRILPLIEWTHLLLHAERRQFCTFLDAGCSFAKGAPGTIVAAQALRRNDLCTKIHGTDITPIDRAIAVKMLCEHRILLYRSDPVRRPPPRKYDVILLANVHRLLTRELQQRLLENLGAALEPMGLLIVNWRFAPQTSPALCLRRWENALDIVGQQNCV